LGSNIGYGLGIGISDINRDGCVDIYVSNDFRENDYLYINNCDGTFTEKLEQHIEILSKFTGWIKRKMQSSKDDVSAACNDYLKVLGLVATGHAWIKVLEVSFKDYENNKQFYEEKIQTANFFFNRVLPKVDSYYTTAISGSKYIMDFKFN